jgi:membrane protein YdbS with pleckstrin-like domain
MSMQQAEVVASTPEPSRRLANDARTVWRLQQLASWGVAVIAGLIAATYLEGTLAVLVLVLPLVGLVLGATIVPPLRWRRWRWDVRPEEIDIRHGTFVIRRTLIPMVRVQHVETSRGWLEQTFALATVRVHTAAGSHTIPLLSLHDADEVRDRIAALARTADAG